MTVWMLALLLSGVFAAVGYNQGAIRIGISLVGLLMAAVLAMPLAPLPGLVLPLVGLQNPLYIWALSPFVVFVVVVILFEVAGQAVHHKVDVYYKYHASDRHRDCSPEEVTPAEIICNYPNHSRGNSRRDTG